VRKQRQKQVYDENEHFTDVNKRKTFPHFVIL